MSKSHKTHKSSDKTLINSTCSQNYGAKWVTVKNIPVLTTYNNRAIAYECVKGEREICVCTCVLYGCPKSDFALSTNPRFSQLSTNFHCVCMLFHISTLLLSLCTQFLTVLRFVSYLSHSDVLPRFHIFTFTYFHLSMFFYRSIIWLLYTLFVYPQLVGLLTHVCCRQLTFGFIHYVPSCLLHTFLRHIHTLCVFTSHLFAQSWKCRCAQIGNIPRI